MDKEGFVINIDDVPDGEEVIKEKVEVQAEVKVEEPPKEKKKEETVTVESEDDGLLMVDTGPEKVEEVAEEDKEKKVEKPEDKSKDGKGDESPTETESPSFLHATALKEIGLLPNLDLEKLKGLSDEEIIKATFDGTQDEIERTVKEITEQQGEAYKQFVEVLDSGGDLEEYARIKASQKRFDGITDDSLEDVETAKALIAEDMKNREYDDAEILETLEDLEEKDKLAARAKPALARLKKRDKDREDKVIADAKQTEEQQKIQRVETMKKIDTTLDGIKEIIPGIPVTPKERQVMKKLMTVPVETKNGVGISRAQQLRSEDPVSYEAKLAYYIGIGLFDKTPSWDKVLKKTKTEVAKKILEKVKDTSKHTPGQAPAKQVKDDEGPLIMPF